jgi:hypothetical protein
LAQLEEDFQIERLLEAVVRLRRDVTGKMSVFPQLGPQAIGFTVEKMKKNV